jgi:hypothetical protein
MSAIGPFKNLVLNIWILKFRYLKLNIKTWVLLGPSKYAIEVIVAF